MESAAKSLAWGGVAIHIFVPHGAPPCTPLATYFNGTKFVPVSPKAITAVFQQAVQAVGPLIGFLPIHVSARSLRASGAMALLCAHVNTDTIQLLGRWHSDEMLRYLHVQAAPIMVRFSRLVVSSDANCDLIPGQEAPSFSARLAKPYASNQTKKSLSHTISHTPHCSYVSCSATTQIPRGLFPMHAPVVAQ
jgi:hypothetical protein